VRVYAGIDPVSKKRHDLVETVPAGPSAAREAERVRTRLLNQVDERRNPRTKATLNQLLDRWLEVVELETTTRNSMEIPARNGLNSPSRHPHAPDCHAAHRQIATIRRCPKRASRRSRPLSQCRSLPGPARRWGPTGRRSPPLELLASTSPYADGVRYSCTERMQTLPSPTADAIRLTEPYRTSPTANTPGMLVSNGSGVFVSGRPLGRYVSRS
jgi:hypothetical protein